nr:hypothetical protein [Tanacetum cinerariifolium]
MGIWYLKDTSIALTAYADADHEASEDDDGVLDKISLELRLPKLRPLIDAYAEASKDDDGVLDKLSLELRCLSRKSRVLTGLDNPQFRFCGGLMGKNKLDVDVQKEKKKDAAKKKDVVPRKKYSFTIADNILTNPNEALLLGILISLTKAEQHDEERQLHKTHARLVIGREQNQVADT